MTCQSDWKCDRCGVTSFGDGTDESPEGWDYMTYGEKETNGSDVCPECVQSFRDWLKNEPQTVTVHHYPDPKEIADIVEREMGKKFLLTGTSPGCTCPKTKVNDPFSTSSVIGWTYRPCPLHPNTVTL